MPRRYPVEFRRKVLDLIEAGKPVAEIAVQLGITAQTATTGGTRIKSIVGYAVGCRRASRRS